jgi:hypothetical protein
MGRFYNNRGMSPLLVNIPLNILAEMNTDSNKSLLDNYVVMHE